MQGARTAKQSGGGGGGGINHGHAGREGSRRAAES